MKTPVLIFVLALNIPFSWARNVASEIPLSLAVPLIYEDSQEGELVTCPNWQSIDRYYADVESYLKIRSQKQREPDALRGNNPQLRWPRFSDYLTQLENILDPKESRSNISLVRTCLTHFIKDFELDSSPAPLSQAPKISEFEGSVMGSRTGNTPPY